MTAYQPESLRKRAIKVGKRLVSRLPLSAMRIGYSVLDLVLPVYLHHLKYSRKPVIVGPWTSEVGHELVYWIPFLEKLKQEGVLSSDKTFVISRGGNSVWYKNITDNYYNVFWDVPAEIYRKSVTTNRAGKLEKRLLVDAFDKEVLKNGTSYFGHDQYHLLHPMVMNNLLIPVWKGNLSVELEEKHLAFCPFPEEDVDLTKAGLFLNQLEEYVAVKFYFSNNFPAEQANLEFTNRVIEALAKRYKVLILQLKDPLDNHNFPRIADAKNVIDCQNIPIAENLRFQTALIRKAKYLVSTLGGFSWLPAFLGRKSFAFYSGTFGDKHVELIYKLFAQLSPDGLRFNDARSFDPVALP